MKVSTIYRKAKELISDKRRWTKGEYARRKDGTPCRSQDPEAVKFCMLGAIFRVSGSKIRGTEFWCSILHADVGEVGINFNDTHTHAEVLELLDRAAKKARKEKR